VEVLAIAGKTPAEVEAVLGAPSSRGTARHGGASLPQHFYKGGAIEVVYVDGKADWITISRLGSVRFGEQALEAIGLTPTAPTFSSRVVMRWDRIQGLREVSIFPTDARRVDYAYILARTKP
jgi:hypothetical protein